jgi:hypothetical protein
MQLALLAILVAGAALLGYAAGARRVAQVEGTARVAAATDSVRLADTVQALTRAADSIRVREARWIVEAEALRAQAGRVREVVRTVRLTDTVEVAAALATCDKLALACGRAADSARTLVADARAQVAARDTLLAAVPARVATAVRVAVSPVLAERDAARAALRRRTWLPRVVAGAACVVEGVALRCGPAVTLGWGVWP